MATTIADALTLLANNKAAIKQAIIDKGVAVSDNDALSTYADKIESIETGGGGGDPDVEGIDLNLTDMGTSSDNPYIIHITKPLTLLRIKESDEVTQYYQFENNGRYTKVMDINDEMILFCVRCTGTSRDDAIGYNGMRRGHSDQFH